MVSRAETDRDHDLVNSQILRSLIYVILDTKVRRSLVGIRGEDCEGADQKKEYQVWGVRVFQTFYIYIHIRRKS